MDNTFLHRLREIIVENMADEHFGVEDLASRMGMSYSQLRRKLRTHSDQTINQFIREVRLVKAIELLEKNELTVSEIAYQVGFGSPSYFNNCFHELYGCTPGQYREQELEKENFSLTSKNNGQKKLKNTIIIIAALLVISLSFNFFNNSSSVFKRANFKEKSIVILPFDIGSHDSADVFFANGLVESIVNKLAAIEDLEVLDPYSLKEFRKNSIRTVQEIGEELHASYLVYGTIQRYGNDLVLFVRLVDIDQNRYLWSAHYRRKVIDALNVQLEVAGRIVDEIQAVIVK